MSSTESSIPFSSCVSFALARSGSSVAWRWAPVSGEASVASVPSLLVAAFGISESTASFALLPAVLSMAIASPFSGRLLDRFGSRIVILAALALFALGMLVIGLLPITWVLVFYVVAGGVVGLGLGMLGHCALKLCHAQRDACRGSNWPAREH